MRDNWEVYNVEESCDILDNMRIPLNGEQRAAIPGGIPYYGANGVQGYISKYLFDEDLILMAEDGGNFEEYSKRPIAYKVSGKSWVNNHAHILRAKKGYNQDYIFYSVVHKNIIPFIKGGTRSKLNLSDLKCVEIEFPPLPQQKKIAKILSTIDAVIEKTESAIAKYQAIKQGLMHDLFTRGIDVNTGKLRPTPQEAPDLYKESVLGLIPREWDIENFENATEIITDFTANGSFESLRLNVKYYYEVNYGRLIRLTDLRQNLQTDGVYVDKSGFEFLLKSELRENDIMLANVGEYTGFACLMPKVNYPATIAPNMFLVRTDKEKFDSKFMYYFMIFPQFTTQVDNVSASSATKLLNKTNFRAMHIPKPKIEEQILFSKKLEALDQKIQTEQQVLAKYEQVKAGLLQDLLTGKVEVIV